jgi:NAD(P)-dependent dehydrogenase (short-subunit alcohol dehydrogenase family)
MAALDPGGDGRVDVRPVALVTGLGRGIGRAIADGLVPAGHWGEAADVGRTVAALATGALPFATGEAVHVDGGLHVARL